MGSSVNTAANVVNQVSVNNIYQESSSICNANCNSSIDDVDIIVRESDVPDGISVNASCSADALCTMKTNLDAIATQQLDAVQTAEAEAPGNAAFVTWPGFSVNTTFNFVNQVLSNSVTQVINSVCNSTANDTINNVTVFLDNSTVQFIDISATGSAKSECAIENTASVSVSQAAASSQTATSTAGSVLVLVFMIIAIAVILIALAWIGYETKKSSKQAEVEEVKTLAPYLKKGSVTLQELGQFIHAPVTTTTTTTTGAAPAAAPVAAPAATAAPAAAPSAPAAAPSAPAAA